MGQQQLVLGGKIRLLRAFGATQLMRSTQERSSHNATRTIVKVRGNGTPSTMAEAMAMSSRIVFITVW